jgi:hypothetical protein
VVQEIDEAPAFFTAPGLQLNVGALQFGIQH